MNKLWIVSVLTTLSLAIADPAALQQLYGTPELQSTHEGHVNHHLHHIQPGHSPSGPRVSSGSSVSDIVDELNTGIKSNSASARSGGNIVVNRNFQEQSVPSRSSINLQGSLKSGAELTAADLQDGFNAVNLNDLTITLEVTKDFYTTYTNVIYNSIPVTLTQFIKTTLVEQTREIIPTPVDDRVFVSTAAASRKDTVSVTDTSTNYRFVTEVSTDLFTITHRAYDIRQQVVTSTLVQTQIIQPTVISTRITTEMEVSTEYQTITNTVILAPSPATAVNFNTIAPQNFFQQQGQFQSGFQSSQNGRVEIVDDTYQKLEQTQIALIDAILELPEEHLLLADLQQGLRDLRNSRFLSIDERRVYQAEFASKQGSFARAVEDVLLKKFREIPGASGINRRGPLESGNTLPGNAAGHRYY